MKARIRTLKPEMWADEKVAALSRDARLLLVGMITLADDEGRFRARRSQLVGALFPEDEDAWELLDEWIAEIKRSKLVLFYVVNKTPYGAFRHWKRHQKINRPTASELPPPPDPEVVEENRVKVYDKSGNFKKTAIPERVRRAVAKAAGAIPGETTSAYCHWCSAEGTIHWHALEDGRPGSWVTFKNLELDHLVPEYDGGATDETNIVLACESCNRRRGHRNGDRHPDDKQTIPSVASVIANHGATHGSVHGSTHGMITEIEVGSATRSDPILISSLINNNGSGLRQTEQIALLCGLLAAHIQRNDEKAHPDPDAESWRTDMRLLVADRHGDVAEVARIIDWCQADGFWRSNILSPRKLRKQFTQLALKAKTPANVTPIGGRRENVSDWLREINGLNGEEAA